MSDAVTKIKSQLQYNSETGVILWKESGKGRRKDLIAGCVKRKKDNTWRRIVLDGQEYTSGQIAWTIKTGKFPDFIIDHMDGDPLNDKWENLRRGDRCVDQRNLKKNRRNSTGVTGVRLNKGYFLAFIGNGSEQEYLGCSKDFFEACCLRKSAEIKYNYSPRHGK